MRVAIGGDQDVLPMQVQEINRLIPRQSNKLIVGHHAQTKPVNEICAQAVGLIISNTKSFGVCWTRSSYVRLTCNDMTSGINAFKVIRNQSGNAGYQGKGIENFPESVTNRTRRGCYGIIGNFYNAPIQASPYGVFYSFSTLLSALKNCNGHHRDYFFKSTNGFVRFRRRSYVVGLDQPG